MPSIVEILARMGNTPDEVAETLRKASIKGIPCNAEECPIANYTSKQCGCDVWVGYNRCGPELSSDTFDMPKPVREFIDTFDGRRAYQDLIEERA